MSAGRALITGGAGFIGAHLTERLLTDGWDVTIADDLSRGRHDDEVERLVRHPQCRFVAVDLADGVDDGVLGGPFTHIVHLAAVVGVQNVVSDPERVLRTNVSTLHSIVDLATRQPALERLVFPSTSEVYAGTLATFGIPFPTTEDVPLTVADPRDARSSYLLSKIYGEALVGHADLPTTVVRPHNVYGPRMGDAHVVPQLLQRIARSAGDPVVVHSPSHRRTFCYVGDAVEYLVRLMVEPSAVGVTVNLGVQEPEITMRELAEMLVEVVGVEVEVVDGDLHQGSPERRQPDTTLLRRITGHEPGVGLRDGVARTWEWYRREVS